jgi:alkylation response protein AidB-like acyl-CoA dehydrogenase
MVAVDSYSEGYDGGLAQLAREVTPEALAEIAAALAATAADYDRSGAFPFENIALLHRHGIVGLAAVRLLDGHPLPLAEARKIIAAVAGGEPSTALALIMTWLFSINAARSPNWPPELRQHVLRDIALNGSLANGLRVEPELGTPVRGGLPATVARRVEGGWRISGRKIFSTGIPALKWLGVWARTEDAEPLVGTFLVPGGTAGVRVEETWDQLGMRATSSHDAVLEDVFIPTENAADIRTLKDWENARAPDQLLFGAVLTGTLYDAVARNARDWLVKFVSERTPSNLGAPLSTLPRFQQAIGELDSILFTSRSVLDRAEAGSLSAGDANFVKYVVTQNAIKVTEKALELVGNPALSRANPLERHFRDALFGRVHSPQPDTILTNAGKSALKAYAAATSKGPLP